MPDSKRSTDRPKIPRTDSLDIRVTPHPLGFKGSSDNPLNEQIVEAINRMGGTGADAEANYQAVVNALRSEAKEVVSIVAEEYRSLPRNQYLDRWSLVQLLVELRDPISLTMLDEILSSQIPPEESKDPHSFSTVGQEIMVRTTAVEAVTRIAADGSPQALELLLKHSRHNNFSVKRVSIQGYLAHGGKDAREALSKILPPDDQYILDIRRTDIRDVPQPQGQSYLAPQDIDQLPPVQLPNMDKD
jgi:hypothetical protein